MASGIERLADQLAEMQAKLDRTARSPQLANSSIENGSLKVKDAAGTTTVIFGQQYDGTAGAFTVAGPNPPAPATPTVAAVPGGLKVSWSGSFPNGQSGFTDPVVAPMDFHRVDVHASTSSGFTPTASTKIGEIHSPAGGAVLYSHAGTTNQTVYTRLVAVSQAGKSSAASSQASATAQATVASATGSTVAARDSSGRTKVANPAAADDAANKAYVDTKFAAGIINVPGGGVDAQGNVIITSGNVSFGKTFANSPAVVATASTIAPGTTVLEVGVNAVTTTGCTIYLARKSTTATNIHWVAVDDNAL